jgi:hypothetical protein
MYTNWAIFCQLMLKLGCNYKIWNLDFYSADFQGRKYFYRAFYESCSPELGHLATVMRLHDFQSPRAGISMISCTVPPLQFFQQV